MESITEYIVSELAKHDQYDGSSVEEMGDENEITVLSYGEYYCMVTVEDEGHVQWHHPRTGRRLNGFCQGLRDRVGELDAFAGEWN